jgi:GNAT superfamily N-acetyltransferase
MRYVPFSETHLADVCALWNRQWEKSFPMREKLLRQNCVEDKNVLAAGSYAAIDESNGTLVGFVVSKIWQDVTPGFDFGRKDGWIHALLVDPRYRGRGVGSELLSRAEAALRESGAQQIHLGNDFHWRMFPGVPGPDPETRRWFERRGYTYASPIYDLFRRYEAGESEPLPEMEGITFRLANPGDRERVVSFMHRSFPGRWDYQTVQYWERGGTGREFVLCEKEGEIIGFCRINDAASPILAQNIYWAPLFQDELGGAGPLGIDEKFRGRGYGLAVVKAGIHFLRQRGIRNIVIDTTAFIDFYGKLGFQVWKQYGRFRKTLRQ